MIGTCSLSERDNKLVQNVGPQNMKETDKFGDLGGSRWIILICI
jgi:hypothetical protein